MKVKINKIEYTIPSNWGDITMGQIQKLYQKDLTQLTELEYQIHLINVLSEIPEEAIKEQYGDWVKRILSKLQWFNEPPKDVILSFTHMGTKYHIVAVKDLTVGEIGIYNQLEKNFNTNLSGILALICRTTEDKFINGKLNYDYDQRVKDFETLPARIGIGISNFFFLKSALIENKLQEQDYLILANLIKRRIEEFWTNIREYQVNMATPKSLTWFRWLVKWTLLKLTKFFRSDTNTTYSMLTSSMTKQYSPNSNKIYTVRTPKKKREEKKGNKI
jgi:hypothetical protein